MIPRYSFSPHLSCSCIFQQEKAIQGTNCAVILLGGGFMTDYKIANVLNVTSHKVSSVSAA